MIRYLLAAAVWTLAASAADIPKGAEFEIRLQSTVSSATSKAKDPIEAVIVTPVLVQGAVAIPSGTKVTGEIATVKSPATAAERAEMVLAFNRFLASAGKQVPVQGRITKVDNSREVVDENGKIIGILASETISAKMDEGLQKLGNSTLGSILNTAKAVTVGGTDASITYEPGTEMIYRVLQPFNWPDPPPPSNLKPVDQQKLYELVNAQPFQTVADNPPKPSDMTNLMFIGTEEAIAKAFTEAGWSEGAELTKMSGFQTFKAIASQGGYKEAPMSILRLEEEAPAMTLQKGLNTFAKRHHLRIFKRPDTFAGKPVWVSSSTQDTGIEFSQTDHTFIHKIDPRVDRERSKVVTDLLFTGGVESFAMIDRPAVPKKSMNATGDDLLTDGKMAVVILK